MAPLVRRTWAPIGQTPILYQRGRSFQKVSMIAALSVSPVREHLGLYFSMVTNGNIIGASVVRFLVNLRCHLQKPLLIVWDRARIHHAVLVRNLLRKDPLIQIEFLPAYAPELDPVEPFWGYLKQNPLSNFAPRDICAVSRATRYHAKRIQKMQRLLRSFLHATPLYCSK